MFRGPLGQRLSGRFLERVEGELWDFGWWHMSASREFLRAGREMSLYILHQG